MDYIKAVQQSARKSFVTFHFFDFNSIKQQAQCEPIQFFFYIIGGGAIKLTLFQPLAPNAVARAIKIENLDVGFAPIDKHKKLPAARVGVQVIGNQPHQSIKGFTHIDRLRAQPDGLLEFEQHD
jgi:hypothetical protein